MSKINTISFFIKIYNKIQRTIIYLFRFPRFAEYHFSDTIVKPIKLTPKFLTLKKYVVIFHHARIEGISVYQEKKYSPHIILKEGVTVQQNLHLTCANSIVIGERTAIAANVTITDIHHPYTDITIPIEYQELEVKYVEIGPDCKIYNNSVILPGTKLGKHTTVGANSVVSGVFPDYCVIAGAPARIIKRYDGDSKRWLLTDKSGNFIDKNDYNENNR